jgi:crossover junction endonuclease MUS81
MLKIIIDNRELSLIQLFESNNDIIYYKENLDIGDIVFTYNDKILIIIERKTLPDLSSSIKDGRYKEQKIRLMNSIDKLVRKIYIIEGYNYTKFTLPKSTLDSVVINTMIRDGLQVIKTNNIEETYQFIVNIFKNLPKYVCELYELVVNEKSECQSTVENHLSYKTSKKENISKQVCFENMLKQIPGISSKIANYLGDKYGNLSNFINDIEEQTESIKYLGEINYGPRRIGKKTAEKIHFYFFENI